MMIYSASVSRRVLFGALVLLFCLVLCVNGAQAADDIKIYVDGERVSSDVSPFIDQNSRTMVPLRFIAESLGAYVDWSVGTEKITIKTKTSLITLAIGSKQAVVDGKTVALDTQPVIKNARTMVPLRFIGEQLGSTVSWNIKEQAVYITKGSDAGSGDNDKKDDGKGNEDRTVKEEVVVNVSSYANIRQGPGTTYPIVTKVQNGTVLGSIGQSGGWYQVLLADNSIGWISGTIVKSKTDYDKDEDKGNDTDNNESKPDPGVRPPSKIDGDSVILHTNSVNIRQGASTSYDILGQANIGDEYPVTGREGDWYRIKLADGRTGYIASWLVAYRAAPGGGKNAPLKDKVIIIDPGHGTLQSGGWTDPGAVSPSGIHERDIVSNIADICGEALTAQGATVIYTRQGSTSITLAGRGNLADRLGADAFIAIHCNSATNSQANGTSTYYYCPSTLDPSLGEARKELAASVQEALVKALGRRDIGILQANFSVLRNNSVPSILVETAFLSNAQEEALLRTPSFQAKAGNAIAEGVANFLR